MRRSRGRRGAPACPGTAPGRRVYKKSFDCQDGGWNPEKGEEKRERERELSEEEEKALTKDDGGKTPRTWKKSRTRRPAQRGAQPGRRTAKTAPRHRAGRPDRQPDRRRAAEYRHRPAAERMAGQRGQRAPPTSAATSSPAGPLRRRTQGADGELKPELARSSISRSSGGSFISQRCVQPRGRKIDYGARSGVNLAPSFTAPNPVQAGEIVGYDGDGVGHHPRRRREASRLAASRTETYPTFTWNFGDGSPKSPVTPLAHRFPLSPCEAPWLSPCAASAFHTYQYGGKYNVTLTVTDVGGNTASVTHEVTVDGPPPPSTEQGRARARAAQPRRLRRAVEAPRLPLRLPLPCPPRSPRR